jgi:hypothetical protein
VSLRESEGGGDKREMVHESYSTSMQSLPGGAHTVVEELADKRDLKDLHVYGHGQRHDQRNSFGWILSV